MKNLGKIYTGLLLLAIFLTFGCASTSGLAASQKIGEKNSPALLYSVYIDESTSNMSYGDFPREELVECVKVALQEKAGFEFIEWSEYLRVKDEVIADAEKKAARKSTMNGLLNFAEVVGGEKSVWDGLTTNTTEVADWTNADIFKAVAKDKVTRGEAFLYVSVRTADVYVKKVKKPCASVTVMICNKKDEIEKQVMAVTSDTNINFSSLSVDEVDALYVELTKKAINLVAENMGKKDGMFESNKIKVDTESLVTSKPYNIYNY